MCGKWWERSKQSTHFHDPHDDHGFFCCLFFTTCPSSDETCFSLSLQHTKISDGIWWSIMCRVRSLLSGLSSVSRRKNSFARPHEKKYFLQWNFGFRTLTTRRYERYIPTRCGKNSSVISEFSRYQPRRKIGKKFFFLQWNNKNIYSHVEWFMAKLNIYLSVEWIKIKITKNYVRREREKIFFVIIFVYMKYLIEGHKKLRSATCSSDDIKRNVPLSSLEWKYFYAECVKIESWEASARLSDNALSSHHQRSNTVSCCCWFFEFSFSPLAFAIKLLPN